MPKSGYSKLDNENTGINVIYDQPGSYQQVCENKAHYYSYYEKAQDDNPTSLEKVVKELLNLNERYLDTCLLNLQQNFVDKIQNRLLKKHFFPKLQLDKLIGLHAKLQEDLELVKYDYKQIFNIFQKHEEEFLTYCDVIPNISQLTDFIITKKITNKEIKEKVEKAEEESCLTNQNQDAQDSLDQSIYRISEAATRYPLILGAIVKEARKLELTTIEKEAQKAQAMLDEIMHHVDKCTADKNNIDTLTNYQTSMNLCEDDFKNLGLLLFEVNEIEIRMKHSKVWQKCCVLVCEELLVVIEVKESEVYEKDIKGEIIFDWIGNPKIKHMTRSYHFPSKPKFKIANFLEINLNEKSKILEMNSFENGVREDPSRSFELKFRSTEAIQEFTKIVKDRQEEIHKFDQAEKGSMHTNHTFFKFQNEYHEQVFFYLKYESSFSSCCLFFCF